MRAFVLLGAACLTILWMLSQPTPPGAADDLTVSASPVDTDPAEESRHEPASLARDRLELASGPRQLRFVLSTDRRPAAFARCWLTDSWRGDVTDLVGLWNLVQDLPAPYVADATGCLTLSPLTGSRIAFAFTEEAWGARNITPVDSAEVECVLEPVRALRVRVRGADGRPVAGMRVWSGAFEHHGFAPSCVSVTTAPSGVAWLPMPGVEEALPQGPYLAPEILALAPPPRLVLPHELARGEVELQLPPLGTVVLDLRYESGAPVEPLDHGLVRLGLDLEDDADGLVVFDRKIMPVLANTVSIPGVQVGVEARLSLAYEADSSTVIEAQVPKLTRDGDVVRAIATVKATGGWITGRVELADRRALPARAYLHVGVIGGRWLSGSAVTDGAFRWSTSSDSQTLRCFLMMDGDPSDPGCQVLPPPGYTPGTGYYSCEIDISAPTLGERLDLGTIVLQRENAEKVPEAQPADKTSGTEPSAPPRDAAPPEVLFVLQRDPLLRDADLLLSVTTDPARQEWKEPDHAGCGPRRLEAAHGIPLAWRVHLTTTGEELAHGDVVTAPKVTLDLRGLAHAHWVEITDAEGKPIRWAAVQSVSRLANGHLLAHDSRVLTHTGFACMVTAAREADLLVTSMSDREPRFVRRAGGYSRVTLGAGLSGELTVQTPCWPDDVEVTVTLSCVEPLAADLPASALPEDRCSFTTGKPVGRFDVPLAGRYEARLDVRLRQGTHAVILATPSCHDVRANGERIAIVIPELELRRAVLALRNP